MNYLRTAFVLITLHALSALALAAPGNFRVLIAQGDPATYVGQGLVVSAFSTGRFNSNGQLATVIHAAPFVGQPATETVLVATDESGRFRVVASQSTSLPNAPAGALRFENGAAPFINDNGDVAFEAQIYPDGIQRPFYETIWSEASGMHLVDTRLTELDHRRYNSIRGFANNGVLLYSRGGYSDGSSVIIGDDPELLIEESNGSRHLFKRYTPVSVGGCPGGQVCFSPYQDFLFDAGLTDDGTAIYGIQLNGNGIDTLNNDVQFHSKSGSTQIMIRDGDPAWGLPTGFRFSHVTGPHVLPNGEVIFPSYLAPPTGPVELQYSLFTNTGGAERLLLRHGSVAPGYGGTKTFGNIELYYATETGRPVVVVELDGDGGGWGLFREESGGLSLVVNNGQPAVGIPDASISASLSGLYESPLTGVTLLRGYWFTAGGAADGDGLWRIDDQGNWELLMSTGQTFTLSPGDERVINSLNPQRFTSNGILPIEIGFTDGSRALISWTDTAQPPVGDFNRDGSVDAADYVMWRKTAGNSILGGYGADLDGNRIVDAADLAFWRANFGVVGGGSAQTIPEPFSFVLCGTIAILCTSGRLRRRASRRSHRRRE